MATVRRLTSAQRAEMLRQGWQTVSGHGSTYFRHVFTFLSTYPPLAQGLYYLLLGLWPLVSADSYQKVTGHQGDVWLVAVIGVLLLAVGGTLCLAAYRKQGSPEVLFLAFGSAGGLAAVDLFLVYRGLSPLYLLDAVLQVALVAFWVHGWRRDVHTATPPDAAAPLAPPAQVVPGPAAPAAAPPPATRM
jgi:hypothetical protein